MSMLAERKRKVKWVINPSKKPLWTTDSDGLNFGKNLMEKMGWSPGKGLGIQEQGIQEPLKIAFKNDTKGIGCKGNDEEWIECQDEFNNLLNELANTDNGTGLKSSEKQNEIKSLEEKSKQSKARVHYQKFLRGKDLAKYSENDLACILGMSQNKKSKDNGKKHVEPRDIEDKCDTSFGVTTINGGSLQDYLNKKWHAYKSKNQTNQSSEVQNTPTIVSDLVNNTWKLEGDGKKKRKHESVDSFSNNYNKAEYLNENGELNYDELSDEMGKHKKKKKALKLIGDYDNIILKEKKDDTILNENLTKLNSKENKDSEESECLSKNIKLKLAKENFENKKRKRKSKEVENMSLEINGDENLEEKEEINCSKKKKKKKSKEIDCNSEKEISSNKFSEEINVILNKKDETIYNSKKKKKKKSKETDYNSEKEVSSNKFSDEINIILNKKDETIYNSKKKKKKKNDLDMEVINSITFLNETIKSESVQENECHHSKRKKKEKKTDSVSVGQINIDNSEKSIIAEVSLPKNDDTSSDIIDIKDTTKVDSKEKKPVELKSNLEVDINLSQSTEEYSRKKKSKKSKKVKEPCEDPLVFNLNEVAEEQKAENEELSQEPKNQLLKIDNDSQSKLQTKKGENVVYSHKPELFKKKKPNVYPQFNKRVLKLSFGFEVHKFKGANLFKLAGYGMKNNEKMIQAR